jgi:hypothetical protein
VQNSTLALKSVTDLGITFELNPRWERTLPFFGNFAWDIHRVPPKDSAPQGHSRVSNINFDI